MDITSSEINIGCCYRHFSGLPIAIVLQFFVLGMGPERCTRYGSRFFLKDDFLRYTRFYKRGPCIQRLEADDIASLTRHDGKR